MKPSVTLDGAGVLHLVYFKGDVSKGETFFPRE
jgi:hypothetical protein